MGSKKRRSKISTRNQSNTEEIREKDREIKRKKIAILRGEEVANQRMMGESNAIVNNIGIILKLCNFIFIYIISFIYSYNFILHNIFNFIVF